MQIIKWALWKTFWQHTPIYEIFSSLCLRSNFLRNMKKCICPLKWIWRGKKTLQIKKKILFSGLTSNVRNPQSHTAQGSAWLEWCSCSLHLISNSRWWNVTFVSHCSEVMHKHCILWLLTVELNRLKPLEGRTLLSHVR